MTDTGVLAPEREGSRPYGEGGRGPTCSGCGAQMYDGFRPTEQGSWEALCPEEGDHRPVVFPGPAREAS